MVMIIFKLKVYFNIKVSLFSDFFKTVISFLLVLVCASLICLFFIFLFFVE